MLIDFCKTLESVRTLLELLKASTKEITNDPSKFPTVQRELVYLLQTCPSLVLPSYLVVLDTGLLGRDLPLGLNITQTLEQLES